MFPANTWCFDLEIINAILGKGEAAEPGIRYCKGWGDHAGMGISVLVAARPDGSEVHVFIGDAKCPEWNRENHIGLFAELAESAELVIGHNSRSFDAKVLAASGIHIDERRHLDFYHEIKKATREPFAKGYKLNDICKRIGGPQKSDDGALAPMLWQRGERQRVIDYCINDIQMTCAVARFYEQNAGKLPDSTNVQLLQLRHPAQILQVG